MKRLSVFLVLLVGCAHQPDPRPTLSATPTEDSTRPPLITENADGTLTIQRETKDGKGLVIKPQVIVPNIARPPEQPN